MLIELRTLSSVCPFVRSLTNSVKDKSFPEHGCSTCFIEELPRAFSLSALGGIKTVEHSSAVLQVQGCLPLAVLLGNVCSFCCL